MDRWLEIDFVYQQDNAAIHVSNSNKQWFIDHNIETMDRPAKSPDLNPIENLWGILVRDVYEDCRQFSSTLELKKAIVEAWNRITLETLSRLIGSMPNRMIETLKCVEISQNINFNQIIRCVNKGVIVMLHLFTRKSKIKNYKM